MINFLKKYFFKIYPALAWTIIIFILLALPGSMLPSEKGFSIPNFDKFVHITLFGLFVVLWCLFYSAKPISKKEMRIAFFKIFIIACLFGTAMEYVQKYFIPMRDFDLMDILADVIGAAIAYIICSLLIIKKTTAAIT